MSRLSEEDGSLLMDSKSDPKSRFQICLSSFFLMLLYWFASISLSLYNKFVLSSYGFRFPLTILLFHFVSNAVLSNLIAWAQRTSCKRSPMNHPGPTRRLSSEEEGHDESSEILFQVPSADDTTSLLFDTSRAVHALQNSVTSVESPSDHVHALDGGGDIVDVKQLEALNVGVRRSPLFVDSRSGSVSESPRWEHDHSLSKRKQCQDDVFQNVPSPISNSAIVFDGELRSVHDSSVSYGQPSPSSSSSPSFSVSDSHDRPRKELVGHIEVTRLPQQSTSGDAASNGNIQFLQNNNRVLSDIFGLSVDHQRRRVHDTFASSSENDSNFESSLYQVESADPDLEDVHLSQEKNGRRRRHRTRQGQSYESIPLTEGIVSSAGPPESAFIDPISSMSWSEYLKKSVSVGVLTAGDFGFSNASLMYISISLYAIGKNSSVVLALVLAFAIGLEKPSCTLTLIILVTVGGVSLGAYHDIHFSGIGFTFILIAAVCCAIRNVVSQVLLQGWSKNSTVHVPQSNVSNVSRTSSSSISESFSSVTTSIRDQANITGHRQVFSPTSTAPSRSSTIDALNSTSFSPKRSLDTISLMRLISPAVALSILPIAAVLEFPSLFSSPFFSDSSKTREVILLLLGGCILAFLLNYSEYLFLKRTSVLTLSLSGVLKEVLAVCFSFVFFDDENMSPLKAAGFIICLAGVLAYNIFRLSTSSQNERVIRSEDIHRHGLYEIEDNSDPDEDSQQRLLPNSAGGPSGRMLNTSF